MEEHVKYDSQSLLQWKTTENCTNMNVLSFYKVKAKSLESLKKVSTYSPTNACQSPCLVAKKKFLVRKSQGRVKKDLLGPASGQFMEEFLVQHLTRLLAPHTEQKGVHISIWGWVDPSRCLQRSPEEDVAPDELVDHLALGGDALQGFGIKPAISILFRFILIIIISLFIIILNVWCLL